MTGGSDVDQLLRLCRATLGSTPYPDQQKVRETVETLRKAIVVTDEEARECTNKLEASLGVSMTLAPVLQTADFKPWLAERRADIDWHFWSRYREMLIAQDNLPPKVVTSMDRITDRILEHCENPDKKGPWDRRGMVVGHVQSGKTANYAGLICKAGDAGFKVIVVIAGLHNRLRNQTQSRIDRAFIGLDSAAIFSKEKQQKFVGVGLFDKSRRPTSFTSSLRDFDRAAATNLNMSVRSSKEPVVFVIKKNASVLRNLIEWLRQNHTVQDGDTIDVPLLLIDDEADNASINIAYSREEVSTINGQIRDLLSLFDRSSYVGYTATPFANIFIDPESDDEMLGDDLFPRDFIVSLNAPSNYAGPTKLFFENAENQLVTIDDAEDLIPTSHKIDFKVTELPPSLYSAVRSFIIARSIRISRGHRDEHMSMLVNASRFTNVQEQLRDELFEELKTITSNIRLDASKDAQAALKNPVIKELHRTWEKSGFSEAGADWDSVQGNLLQAVESIQVVAINSNSSDPLDYQANQDSGLAVIVVGGLSLSRGLTLEGLMTSYFHRRTLMYDTLMQMGRWFGYREGYEDLCRVYMSEETQGWYEHITESVELLHQEFRQMEANSAAPKDFGLKVRSHPDSLLITARNKHGVGEQVRVAVGLANSFVETATLRRDSKALNANREAAQRLASKVGVDSASVREIDPQRHGHFRRKVPAEDVIDFLANFANHEDSVVTEPGPIRRYVETRSLGSLATWDVLFVSRKPNEVEQPNDLIGPEIFPQRRTAGKRSDLASIRVTDKQRVASRGIERVGLSKAEIENAEGEYLQGLDPTRQGNPTYFPDHIYRARRRYPLLLIHLLEIIPSRKPQFEFVAPDEAVVAWGISFPRLKDGDKETRVEYMVNARWLEENSLGDFDGSDDSELYDE